MTSSSAHPPVISVVYVNYDTTAPLIDSLRSLRANLSICHEVIVVDNASASEPLDRRAVEDVYPGAEVVYSPTNLGFGLGNNLGAERASGRYLWILNTDTIVPPGHHLELLVDVLDTNPRYGAALPRILNPDGSVQDGQVGRFPTALRILGDKLGIPGSLYYRHSPGSQDVEFATCAALLVRTDAYREIGGFSKEYFLYFEDTDLSKKLAEAGWRTRHVTDAQLVHIGGASIARNAARKRIYYEHQDIYFRRWHGPLQRLLVKLMAAPMRVRHGATRVQMEVAGHMQRV